MSSFDTVKAKYVLCTEKAVVPTPDEPYEAANKNYVDQAIIDFAKKIGADGLSTNNSVTQAYVNTSSAAALIASKKYTDTAIQLALGLQQQQQQPPSQDDQSQSQAQVQAVTNSDAGATAQVSGENKKQVVGSTQQQPQFDKNSVIAFAKEYLDVQIAEVISKSNAYTDAAVQCLKSQCEKGISTDTVSALKKFAMNQDSASGAVNRIYTDKQTANTLVAAYAYTDNALKVAKAHAEKQSSEILERSNEYSDAQLAAAVATLNIPVAPSVIEEANARQDKDDEEETDDKIHNCLKAAQDYTDIMLAAAKEYTDTRISMLLKALSENDTTSASVPASPSTSQDPESAPPTSPEQQEKEDGENAQVDEEKDYDVRSLTQKSEEEEEEEEQQQQQQQQDTEELTGSDKVDDEAILEDEDENEKEVAIESNNNAEQQQEADDTQDQDQQAEDEEGTAASKGEDDDVELVIDDVGSDVGKLSDSALDTARAYADKIVESAMTDLKSVIEVGCRDALDEAKAYTDSKISSSSSSSQATASLSTSDVTATSSGSDTSSIVAVTQDDITAQIEAVKTSANEYTDKAVATVTDDQAALIAKTCISLDQLTASEADTLQAAKVFAERISQSYADKAVQALRKEVGASLQEADGVFTAAASAAAKAYSDNTVMPAVTEMVSTCLQAAKEYSDAQIKVASLTSSAEATEAQDIAEIKASIEASAQACASNALSSIQTMQSYADSKAGVLLQQVEASTDAKVAAVAKDIKDYVDTTAVPQLTTAIENAAASAKSYTDTQIDKALDTTEEFAKTQAESAVATAKAYTDSINASSTIVTTLTGASSEDIPITIRFQKVWGIVYADLPAWSATHARNSIMYTTAMIGADFRPSVDRVVATTSILNGDAGWVTGQVWLRADGTIAYIPACQENLFTNSGTISAPALTFMYMV